MSEFKCSYCDYETDVPEEYGEHLAGHEEVRATEQKLYDEMEARWIEDQVVEIDKQEREVIEE